MPTRKALKKSNQYMRKTVKAQLRRSIRTSSKKANPSKKALAKSAQYMRNAIALRQPQNRGYKVKRFANDQGVFGVRVILDEDTDIQNLLNMINNLSHDFSQESSSEHRNPPEYILPQTPPGYAETVNTPEFVAHPASPGNDDSRYDLQYAQPPPGAASSVKVEKEEEFKHHLSPRRTKRLLNIDIEEQTYHNKDMESRRRINETSCAFRFPQEMRIGGHLYSVFEELSPLSFRMVHQSSGVEKFMVFTPLSGLFDEPGFCSIPNRIAFNEIELRKRHQEKIAILENSKWLLKLESYAAITLLGSTENQIHNVMFWVQIFAPIRKIFPQNDFETRNKFADFKDQIQRSQGVTLKQDQTYQYVMTQTEHIQIFDINSIDFDG